MRYIKLLEKMMREFRAVVNKEPQQFEQAGMFFIENYALLEQCMLDILYVLDVEVEVDEDGDGEK
jgi:hypothetical protein